MKRQIQRKLTLNKETLRDLSDVNLGVAVGGIRSDNAGGGVSNCTDGCQFHTMECTDQSECC